MPLIIPNRPFGLREVDFAPWTGSAYGTAVKADTAQEFTVNVESDTAVLAGDDEQKEQVAYNFRAAVTSTIGALHLEFEAAVTGATLATSGISPTQVKSVTYKSTDFRPYGKIRGRMINANGGGGDDIIELPYVRFLAGPSTGAGQGNFAGASYTGVGLPHPTDKVFLKKSQRETAAELT